MKKTVIIILFVIIYISANAKVGKIRMMFNENPSTSVTLAWVQESGKSPILAYDSKENLDADGQLTLIIKPQKNWKYRKMHHYFVSFDNLQPETIYYFQIVDSEGSSEQYWFKTLPENPKKLSIIAGGDSRSYPLIRRMANKMVAKLQPDFVVFDGDFTALSSCKQWAAWLDDWQLTISDGRIIPIVVAKGNHEIGSEMEKIFNTPNNSIYSLDFGNLFHLIILNSETKIEGKQTEWLLDNLQNTSAIWKSAVYHKPMRPHYSQKEEGEAQYQNWATPFYENNVRLVVEGDTHTCKITYAIRPDKNGDEGFVRDDENGTIYIGEGCWGAPARDADDNKSWTMKSEKVNQFKWLFIDTNQVEIRTVLYENVDDVEKLTYENKYKIPKNINLWEILGKDVVIIDAK